MRFASREVYALIYDKWFESRRKHLRLPADFYQQLSTTTLVLMSTVTYDCLAAYETGVYHPRLDFTKINVGRRCPL